MTVVTAAATKLPARTGMHDQKISAKSDAAHQLS